MTKQTSAPITISDIKNQLGSQREAYKAFADENLGSMTLKMSFSLRKFLDISWVANQTNNAENELFRGQQVAQRRLIPNHAKGLAQYTLMGLVNAQIQLMRSENRTVHEQVEKIATFLPSGPYASLQPLVCNIRDCVFGGSDLEIEGITDRYENPTGTYRVALSQKQLFYVVDGQHRREGFQQVLDFLMAVNRTYKYPPKGIFVPPADNQDLMSDTVHGFWQEVLEIALTRSNVAVEVHLGLSPDQEQQLFVDLNARSKAVGTSFVNSFDHADPINKFINEDLLKQGWSRLELSDQDQSDWGKDEGKLLRKDVKTICSLLMLGSPSSQKATPALVESRKAFALKFWEILFGVPGFCEKEARTKTVLQQPVVMKALAKLANDLAHGKTTLKDVDGLKNLYESIRHQKLDFSHAFPIWGALLTDTASRNEKFKGIENFVHIPKNTNLDAGNWDANNKWVRFGSRHNDIYPRLGDTIRWKLSLKVRPSVQSAQEKEKLNEA